MWSTTVAVCGPVFDPVANAPSGTVPVGSCAERAQVAHVSSIHSLRIHVKREPALTPGPIQPPDATRCFREEIGIKLTVFSCGPPHPPAVSGWVGDAKHMGGTPDRTVGGTGVPLDANETAEVGGSNMLFANVDSTLNCEKEYRRAS